MGLVAAVLAAAPAAAAVQFWGVAAGEATGTEAVLWTRAVDATPPALAAQLSRTADFASIDATVSGTAEPARDWIVKLEATGLQPGTQYHYRFRAATGETSPAGSFRTAPAPDQAASFRLGFSGDADGRWRPYPLMQGIASQNLDAYVFLGDTMYETASAGSAATSDPAADPAQALADYRRKYRENREPVNAGGAPGLQAMFAAQGTYTLLDNHELGNRQFQAGGAPQGTPPGAGAAQGDPAADVNTTGAFMNQTAGFRALMRAYLDYHPIRERSVAAPDDPRSDGTQRLYYAQRWGRNAVFVNVDDRSYRDIRLQTPRRVDDTGPRADNPARTMLGKTQLAWLQRTLLEAETAGVTWKLVAISSPIDAVATRQDAKSWLGGYRAERNALLRFIAENRIGNVVFLTTDDHYHRVNQLTYVDAAGQTQRLQGALLLVAGPMGAGGPDVNTDHSFAAAKRGADDLAAEERAAGTPAVGLDPATPGLRDVVREGDPEADRLRQPVDFFSPDTFNYDVLDIGADGRTLTVQTWGIDSYAQNLFREVGVTGAPRMILSFKLDAQPRPR